MLSPCIFMRQISDEMELFDGGISRYTDFAPPEGDDLSDPITDHFNGLI